MSLPTSVNLWCCNHAWSIWWLACAVARCDLGLLWFPHRCGGHCPSVLSLPASHPLLRTHQLLPHCQPRGPLCGSGNPAGDCICKSCFPLTTVCCGCCDLGPCFHVRRDEAVGEVVRSQAQSGLYIGESFLFGFGNYSNTLPLCQAGGGLHHRWMLSILWLLWHHCWASFLPQGHGMLNRQSWLARPDYLGELGMKAACKQLWEDLPIPCG